MSIDIKFVCYFRPLRIKGRENACVLRKFQKHISGFKLFSLYLINFAARVIW